MAVAHIDFEGSRLRRNYGRGRTEKTKKKKETSLEAGDFGEEIRQGGSSCPAGKGKGR